MNLYQARVRAGRLGLHIYKMPLKSFKCSICGARCPKKYLAHGQFEKRMSWLRNHRKRKHGRKFKKSIRKGVRTRKKG